MNPLVVKVVPTVLALAAGVYVVWPYLGPGGGVPAAAKAAPAPPELADALLRPKLSAPPSRNPFVDPEDKRAQARQEIRTWIAGLLNRVTTTRKQAEKVAGGPHGGKGGRGDLDPLDGLALNATYAREGAKAGAALINGRLFETGQNVRPDEPADPFELVEVRLHSVVLRHRGQNLELKYGLAVTSAHTGGGAARSKAGATRPKTPAVKRAKSPKTSRS